VVKNGFPSEEERELVRKYVIERDLYRPPITYLKAMVLEFTEISHQKSSRNNQ